MGHHMSGVHCVWGGPPRGWVHWSPSTSVFVQLNFMSNRHMAILPSCCSASADTGALKRAEWIKYVALFFNLESTANAYFAKVQGSYRAQQAAVKKAQANGGFCSLQLTGVCALVWLAGRVCVGRGGGGGHWALSNLVSSHGQAGLHTHFDLHLHSERLRCRTCRFEAASGGLAGIQELSHL